MTEHLYPDQSSVQEQQVAPADGEVETVACEWCGWSLCNRQLGNRALKMDAEEAPKVPKRRFETPEEMLAISLEETLKGRLRFEINSLPHGILANGSVLAMSGIYPLSTICYGRHIVKIV